MTDLSDHANWKAAFSSLAPQDRAGHAYAARRNSRDTLHEIEDAFRLVAFLGERGLETALAELDARPVQYNPNKIARDFVGIDTSGVLRVERGYVPPEDEPAIPEPRLEAGAASGSTAAASVSEDAAAEQAGTTQAEEQRLLRKLTRQSVRATFEPQPT